ncbi:MAG: hypothetical protein ACI8RZ_005718 [Myxococcota bacterium]|jgi:hypothetical protein
MTVLHSLLLLTLLSTGCTSDTGKADDASEETVSEETTLDGDGCRTHEDCQALLSNPEAFCVDADDSLCGICQDPERPCETRSDCGDGMACEPYEIECPCSSDNIATQCIPECSPGECGDSATCDETTGLCEATHCSDGATCPDHHTCSDSAEGTGCEREACSTDGDCEDVGFCVKGGCFDALGYCEDDIS